MRQFKPAGQMVIASLMTALVLLLNGMAASPSLHELIHADAGKPDHECAVTLFAHGQVDSASVAVPIIASLVLIQTVPSLEISVFHPIADRLRAGRAPPVLPAIS
jgi:hypothetical protein